MNIQVLKILLFTQMRDFQFKTRYESDVLSVLGQELLMESHHIRNGIWSGSLMEVGKMCFAVSEWLH